MKASEIGLPTHEASVSCGQWCLGGTANMTPTTHAEHEDAEFVWVRGDVAGAALAALRAERDEAVALLRKYRFCGDDYPRDGWPDINAFLAKHGEQP